MPETNFFWKPLSDNILQERDETGTVTAEYTTEPGLYGNLISQSRSGGENQYHFDALGSTLALTDNNQQVTDTEAYTAFGEVTEHTGSAVNLFQYAGKTGCYRNEPTHESWVRRRMLIPTSGRWFSVDPHLTCPVSSLYAYAFNRPIMLTDPSGLWPGGGFGFYQQIDVAPHATGTCGGAEADVYWRFSDPREDLDGCIIQFVRFNYKVFNCNDTPRQDYHSYFFEAWQVIDGIVYRGLRNEAGTNTMPPGTDHIGIGDRGAHTKGKIQVRFSVSFLKDYVLTFPPWGKPGDPEHDPRSGNLPSHGIPPLVEGFNIGNAISKMFETEWDC